MILLTFLVIAGWSSGKSWLRGKFDRPDEPNKPDPARPVELFSGLSPGGKRTLTLLLRCLFFFPAFAAGDSGLLALLSKLLTPTLSMDVG